MGRVSYPLGERKGTLGELVPPEGASALADNGVSAETPAPWLPSDSGWSAGRCPALRSPSLRSRLPLRVYPSRFYVKEPAPSVSALIFSHGPRSGTMMWVSGFSHRPSGVCRSQTGCAAFCFSSDVDPGRSDGSSRCRALLAGQYARQNSGSPQLAPVLCQLWVLVSGVGLEPTFSGL